MKTVVAKTQSIKLDKPGEYVFSLTKPGVELTVQGVFETADTEAKTVEVVIHHQAPHTKATTTLKGVARDASQIKFVGRIIIDEKCGDSNSFLTERILLLSDKAKAEAIPELEILADDVKCSHAASVSNIPDEHLFYLMSRGLSRPQAEALIVEGFLS